MGLRGRSKREGFTADETGRLCQASTSRSVHLMAAWEYFMSMMASS
jgi:hypothetical protein